jgi:hypothetical protein
MTIIELGSKKISMLYKPCERSLLCASVKINLGIAISVKCYTKCVIVKQVLESGIELE